MEFKYKGLNKLGENVKGVIDAENLEAAKEMLVAEGIRVISLEEYRGSGLKVLLLNLRDWYASSFFGRLFGRSRRRRQMLSLEEELLMLGYSSDEIKHFLRGYDESNFDVDHFSKNVLELNTLQKEKVKSGSLSAHSVIEDMGSTVTSRKRAFRLGVSRKSLILFTEQMSILLSTGVGLMESIEAVKDNITDKRLRKALDMVLYDLSKGLTFSEALEARPDVFSDLYVSMVKVGESTGSELYTALRDLVDFLKMEQLIISEARKTAVYPSIVLVVLFAVAGIMSSFVIPRLREVFMDMDVELPLLTKIIFSVSDNMVLYALSFVIIFGLSFYLLLRIPYTREMLKYALDWFVLNFPIISNVVSVAQMYRLSLTMAITTRNGIAVDKSILLANQVTNNQFLKKDLEKVYFDLESGLSLTEAFAEREYILDILKMAISSGQESGLLSESLSRVSEYYGEELEDQVESLMNLMGPLSIIMLALAVAPFLIGIYLPIVSLTDQIGNM